MWRLIPHWKCRYIILYPCLFGRWKQNEMKLAITKYPSFRVMSSSPATDANADDRNDNDNEKSEKNNGPRRNVRGFCWCVKSCCGHFKFVPCYSWSVISPYAKFYPNWTKNTEVRNFHFWSILVGRAGRSKNGRRHIKLIQCCFWPLHPYSPYTKFHPNRMKNTEVENIQFWSILVGRAGKSKNGRSHFKHSIAVWKVTNDLYTKFKLNRMKIGRVSPFLNFWLVGWLGRSAWVKLAPELWFKADSHK